jgi:pilus assembly protein CpaC
VKSKKYNNERNPTMTIKSAGLSVAAIAISVVAMSPACLSQGVPVAAPVRASIVDAPSIPKAMISVSRLAFEGKALHVTVGHSIFIDTKTRLRRVYVTDPAILNSVTLSPNQIVVTAMSPGVGSLTLMDETGLAQSYVVSADLDIDGLRSAMSAAMRGDAVKVEGSGARVTLSGIVGSDAIADSALKLAGQYSKEVANALTVIPFHPKQVRLEVRILEVDRSKLLQLGINLFNPGGNTSFLATTTSSQFPATATLGGAATSAAIGTLAVSNPLSFMLYSSKLNLGTTIQDLQTKQVLQILAEPTITTISGQKANFLSGGEFPFPVVQPGSGGGAPVISISFRPFGVKVEFTPIVNEDGTIRLKVAPEVSALDYSNAVSVSGITIPALSTRRAETEVELRSSQSFAISGLLDQRTTDIMSKNPGAASIPILGYLFKAKNVNHSTTELIVVVTPTVVDPLSEVTEPVQPELPIRTLDTGSFDKSLGKNLNPKPAAPPIDPDRPPYGNQTPAPPTATPAPVVAPAPGAAQDATPSKTPQSAPAFMPADPAIASAVVPRPKISPAAVVVASSVAQGPLASHSASAPRATGRSASKTTSVVEIMTLSHESDAEAMVAALKRHGYDIAVNHEPHDSLLHLNIGPFASRRDAEAMRQRLLLDGYNATIK